MKTNRYIMMLTATAALIVGAGSTAWAQADCNPQCAAGQMCVQGVCMVPAAPAAAPAAPPPAYYPPPPPPPGYYAPPASAPAPGYYPPPQSYAPPPPREPSIRTGFLALPYMGLHSFQGSTANDLGVGFRIGTLLGGHINEMFSINGELTIDALNIENVAPGLDESGVSAVIAISPLYHLAAGSMDFVVGPKVGLHSGSTTVSDNLGGSSDYTVSGYVLGVNAGLFGAVGNSMAIGGLINFDVRTIHEFCQPFNGDPEVCSTDSGTTGPADKVLGFSAALLF